jgi:hypothetical protein
MLWMGSGNPCRSDNAFKILSLSAVNKIPLKEFVSNPGKCSLAKIKSGSD